MVGDRLAQTPKGPAASGPPDYQPRHVAGTGESEQFVGGPVINLQCRHLRAERLGQLQGLAGQPPHIVGQRLVPRCHHRCRNPGNAGAVGHTLAGTDQRFGGRGFVDADQDALLCRPGAAKSIGLHQPQHLVVDAAGGRAQRELAQRRQIGLGEVIVQCPADGAAAINLALMQPLDQLFGRQVDHLDLVGALEHLVRHGLLHPDAGDAGDDVVEAFNMLDVERRDDINPGVEQLHHVLPALGVARARHIGVSQLVDQRQSRPAGQQRIEVEFLKALAAIVETLTRQQLKSLHQGFGFDPSMGFDQPHHHIDARF